MSCAAAAPASDNASNAVSNNGSPSFTIALIFIAPIFIALIFVAIPGILCLHFRFVLFSCISASCITRFCEHSARVRTVFQ
jgi:hypothetical protein